jgi:integrase
MECGETKEPPHEAGVLAGGSDRHRSGDLSIFSRTLYQLSYRAMDTHVSHLATLTGLEPATSAVTGRHANQLRYRAMLLFNYLRLPLV